MRWLVSNYYQCSVAARTMIVQQRPFTQAKVSSRVLVGMQLFPEEGIEWTAENMRLITSMIEVKPISVSL